jgi:hypothetical protein
MDRFLQLLKYAGRAEGSKPLPFLAARKCLQYTKRSNLPGVGSIREGAALENGIATMTDIAIRREEV